MTLLQGFNALPKSMAVPVLRQEAVVLAFRKLFPSTLFDKFKFAMIEDLISAVRQMGRIGCQVGAMTHRAALPPLLPFNLEPDEHFRQALLRAQEPLPFEDLPVADADLRFATSGYSPNASSLRSWREQAVGALKELKRRWEGVTLHLRRFQEPAVANVTHQRDIGLIALMMVLTSWADTGFPYGLVTGLPAVGFAPLYSIFPQQPAQRISIDDVMLGWEAHNQAIVNNLRPSKTDTFLLQQSIEDAEKGFCTMPMKYIEFRSGVSGRAYRVIPRCVVHRAQASNMSSTMGTQEGNQNAPPIRTS